MYTDDVFTSHLDGGIHMNFARIRTKVFASCICLVAITGSVHASSLDQIVNALLPATADSRGLQRAETVQSNAIAQNGSMPTATLIVSFNPEGHILTVDGMRQLRTLAKALEDPRLASSQFQIRAYAYTPSSPGIAQPLSSRRAQSIFEHLDGFYGIGADKVLGIQGLGASDVNLGNPSDPLNQRVEIVNISVR